MSTQVNIDVNGFVALKQQADEVARANKESAVQQEDSKKVSDKIQQNSSGSNSGGVAGAGSSSGGRGGATQADSQNASVQPTNPPSGRSTGAASSAQKRGDIPSSSLVRELSAQNIGQRVVPFVISWRGEFTGEAERTALTKIAEFEILGTGRMGYSLITHTHRGGRDLTPSPIRFATAASLLSIPEIPRFEKWSLTADTCESSSSPTECLDSSYRDTSVHPGYWLTAAKRSSSVNIPYVPIENAPVPLVNLPVGDTAYRPSTQIVTVASDGTIFLTFNYPRIPKNLTAISYESYTNSGYPDNSLVSNARIDMPYSYAYDPYYGLATLIVSRQKNRYIFLRAKGASIQSKIVEKEQDQDFLDFLDGNLYSDDPSRTIRKAGYLGEYRIRGSKAKFLRFRDEDQVYSAFPYGYLEQYKTNEVPVFTKGEGFEDWTYDLTPGLSTAELKTQLTNFEAATDLQVAAQNNRLPVSRAKIPNPTGLFARSEEKLGNDPGEDLTPKLYVAIGQ